MKILVIVPAFNEEAVIGDVIKDLKENFPEGNILVINDGSQDATSREAKAFDVTVIDLPYNIGIGGAMQTGFLHAQREGYDIAIQCDGDGQHRAEEIRGMLRFFEERKADLIVGSRFLADGEFTSSFQRMVGIKILSRIVSIITGRKISDSTSGFRIYGRKTIDLFSRTYPEDYPEVESLILAHKKGLAIEEVPSVMRPRTAGESSITPAWAIHYMFKVLLAIFIDLLKKPDEGGKMWI